MYSFIHELNGHVLPKKFKAQFLLKHLHSCLQLKDAPVVWQKDLVCIIKHRQFENAQYVSNQLELDLLVNDASLNKMWLLVKNAKTYAK